MTELQKVIDTLNSHLLNKKIQISISLDGVSLIKGLDNKDIIGGVIQSAFYKILRDNNIQIRNNDRTQEFPDFFVGEKDEGMIELKTYNAEKSANFDVANFDSFCEKLMIDPKSRLNADYIILGYTFDSTDNSFQVTKIFSKKIYEICSKRNQEENKDQLNLPLKCQVKKGMIYNIRPRSSFDSKKIDESKSINDPKEFISLIAECKEINSKTKNIPFNKKEWIEEILTKYAS